jgi:dethiobiotin synthetase
MSRGQFLFITGTDTGAGKTTLTALLLHHLRASGVSALALKPICTGPRTDVRLLQSLQRGALTDDEMNPFCYPTPAAPITAARACWKKPTLTRLKKAIERAGEKCDLLLIEGAGGLMVPLAKDLTWEELLQSLQCPVLVAANNKLGVINHTLLTVKRLQSLGAERLGVCLMNQCPARGGGKARQANFDILRENCGKVPVFEIPFLGGKPVNSGQIQASQKKIKKVLVQILKIM